jgi:hypothetical protein
MKSAYLIAATIVVLLAQLNMAFAQDKTCAKIKNKKHQAACNCAVSNGGYAFERGDGRIFWQTPGGDSRELNACLSQIM